MTTSPPTQATLADRRFLAVRRVAEGLPPAQVAQVLGVHVETVRLWARAHKAGGDAALRGNPHPGRRPFLTAGQEAEVRSWLARRPTEFGFLTDLWTAARVAQLVRDTFGVAYHPNYLREWLASRGYSPQKPRRQARQQKPEQVAECRALNQRCAVVFRRRRGVPDVRHTSKVICYHQRRNARAAKSHKKQRHRCVL